MIKLLPVLLVLFLRMGYSQDSLDLSYYLPQDISYDPSIPTPKEIIGHEVGEWHVTHDKLVFYMQALAKASNRISLENRGETFEGRPLLLLTITTPENIKISKKSGKIMLRLPKMAIVVPIWIRCQ